ncbi:uncharacterized protein ARMOST_16383 [Armillaria ostoyae]|uniref:Uncharacterized protein n=1 Tax=Armillaria ostoyae TaxID=47428 RepID=A0A284RW02_ARMOS|nr:uncharacterized protein ARMOST_16383 [Armillaria ostoyae]
MVLNEMHSWIIGASEFQSCINLSRGILHMKLEVEHVTSGAGSALALEYLIYLSLRFTNSFPCLDHAKPHVWGFTPVSAIPTRLCMGVDNGSVDEEERQTYVHIEQVILQPSHSPTHSSTPVAPDSHRTYLLHGYARVFVPSLDDYNCGVVLHAQLAGNAARWICSGISHEDGG